VVASLISVCKLRLYSYRSFVFDFLDMSRGSSAFAPILGNSYGTHLLESTERLLVVYVISLLVLSFVFTQSLGPKAAGVPCDKGSR